MTKIGIIIGSVREGRVTENLSKWVAAEVSKVAEVEILDLRDYPLPFLNEPVSPRMNADRVPTPEVKKWLDKIAACDGYVITTPEYNRSIPGVLKNALDMLGTEADNKPAALVAHGSTGGAQAVATLRITLPGNGIVTIPTALFFRDHVGQSIDEEGVLKAELHEGPYSPQNQLVVLANAIVTYADALKSVRG